MRPDSFSLREALLEAIQNATADAQEKMAEAGAGWELVTVLRVDGALICAVMRRVS